MKIIFFGTAGFCPTHNSCGIIIDKLVHTGHKPIALVTAPDMPVGRNQTLTPPLAKVSAQKHGIEIIQTEKLDARVIEKIRTLHPDIIILAAYGIFVPKQVLEIPTYGALCIHPSLLPELRGPSPVQYAILEGKEKTGVSIIQMDQEIDHGPILAQKELHIASNATALALSEQLAQIGGDLLVETLPQIINRNSTPKEQNHAKATFTKKLSKEDGHIDLNKSAEYRERQVRAFFPWPGTFAFWKRKRIKILKAHTQEGKFVIDELQMEGKKPTTKKEFLLGYKDFDETMLK